MNFFSHPKVPLINHLSEVQSYSMHYGYTKLQQIHEVVAYCHDFGKYTTYFQDRLFGREKGKKEEGNHAHISAIFCAYVLLQQNKGEEIFPLLTYSVILSHHSRVKDVNEYLPQRIYRNKEIPISDKIYLRIRTLNKQLLNMRKNQKTIFSDYQQLELGQEFHSFINGEHVIEDTLIRLKKLRTRYKKGDYYWIHQSLFSVLITADKMSASKTNPIEPRFIPYKRLKEIKNDTFKKLSKNTLNNMRNDIFQKVQISLQKHQANRLFSITSPTGSGKTITGFYAALKLKELKTELKKIIYVLPYTSIIDQNYKVIHDLYTQNEGVKNKEYHYLMKHHHLSKYEKDRDDEIHDSSNYQMLLENWESGTIVTTFVQLLETVIGAKNKMLKKFHVFKDAILVMDEVQALDIEYYPLLNYIFQKLQEELNCHIIIMTATKPLFFPEAIELLDEHEKYFAMMNRTKIISHVMQKITIEDFTDNYIDQIEDKSYLIVVNTISQSLNLCQEIKEKLKQENEYSHQLYYLSTNLIPKHRVERIIEIEKKLKKEEKIILISTQVVEAGVDLDFDEVYRDIAPLDSIIQCAGRCNRNNRGFIGKVHITQMVDENDKTYGRTIYGPILIHITESLLASKEIEEKEYLFLINQYYELIKEEKTQDKSKNFISSIETMNFQTDDPTEIGRFTLIPDSYDYVDVFITIDKHAKKLLDDLKNAYHIEDRSEKQKVLLPLKKDIQQYIVSMPKKFLNTFESYTITKEYNIPYLPLEGIESYYDTMTGFKREKDDNMIML